MRGTAGGTARRRGTSARSRSTSRDEHGAVALMTAAISMVLVVISAFVVDIGMQRVARTDMQTLADMVSLDLSRHLDGAQLSTYQAGTWWDDEVASSVARNGTTLGDAPVVTTQLGVMNGSTGDFEPSEFGTDIPRAVKVTANTNVDFAFGVVASGGASRSAVAAANSFACYKVGSWAGKVDTADSVLLNPVLRQMAMQSGAFSNGATVSALDYRGLGAATVNLGDLAGELGVGSIDQLARSTVAAKDFYAALGVLARPDNTTTVNALNALALTSKATTVVDLSKILAANSGAGSLLDAQANLLDLVGGSVALLNGVNTANVYLGAALPSLANAGLVLRLTQGPHQYCGSPGDASTVGVTSDTEQLYARIGGQLAPTTVDFVPPAITGLLSNVTSATIIAENYATFDLSVAGTSSQLTSISCGTTSGVGLAVSNGLATITFSTPLRAEVNASLAKGPLGGLLKAVIRINASVTVTAVVGQSGVVSMSISVPPQAFDTAYPTTSGGVNITSITRNYGNVTANVSVVGGLLGANISLTAAEQTKLLDTILSSGLTSLMSPTDPHSLATTVFDPMLALVGARVGGSDVIVDSTPELGCAQPRMVG